MRKTLRGSQGAKNKPPVPDDLPRPSGRPRSESARLAILKAGYKLLGKASVRSISTQQIAAEAGVSTATLYRWWPTKEAVLLDSYLSKMDDQALLRTGGSPLRRLREHTVTIGQLFEGEHGRVTVRLLMAIQEDESLREAFFERLYRPKTDLCMTVMREAIDRGELPQDTDSRLFLDQIFGVMLVRLLIRHERIDKTAIGSVFDSAVAGTIRPGSARRNSVS